MKAARKLYPCPQCGKKIAWLSSNSWRPFCSQGCSTVDLGRWASDEYSIPDQHLNADDTNLSDK